MTHYRAQTLRDIDAGHDTAAALARKQGVTVREARRRLQYTERQMHTERGKRGEADVWRLTKAAHIALDKLADPRALSVQQESTLMAVQDGIGTLQELAEDYDLNREQARQRLHSCERIDMIEMVDGRYKVTPKGAAMVDRLAGVAA